MLNLHHQKKKKWISHYIHDKSQKTKEPASVTDEQTDGSQLVTPFRSQCTLSLPRCFQGVEKGCTGSEWVNNYKTM